MQTLDFEIKNLPEPVRIDKYIAGIMQDLSRNRIQHLIKSGFVNLNKTTVKRTGEKVKSGDRITLHLPPPEPSDVLPEPSALEILYEDEHIVGINKPAGITVHPTEQNKTGTLVNFLLHHIDNLSGIGGVLRPGIVHRLDRVTSGVLLAAKNNIAHRKLSEQFKARRIKKVYCALVHGSLSNIKGKIDLPIGRHPTNRKKMAIVPEGRRAITYYRILQTGLGGSFIEVYPLTGRTHQIRVHLKHVGIPVVGDSVYTLKKYAGRGEMVRLFQDYPGIALHAHTLKFTHPIYNQEMYFEAPLPKLFEQVRSKLK